MCNSLGYCCWCHNPDNRKVYLEQFQEDESIWGGFTFDDEDETEFETIGEDNPNSSSVRPHSFMEIYNITYEEMASLRSENIQLWRSKFPSLTFSHLKQLNDQTVVTTRRLLTERRFSHLNNQQMVNIFIDIFPAERPIPGNQIRQLCEIYHLKTEDVKYIHLLVSRWLPYYQIET
jgi:hypothetical protein